MVNPIIALCGALFCTSVTAALAALEVKHFALARCYLAYAVIYAALGLCHALGM
jgi:hypothetical protein